jgi:hypothetical protein
MEILLYFGLFIVAFGTLVIVVKTRGDAALYLRWAIYVLIASAMTVAIAASGHSVLGGVLTALLFLVTFGSVVEWQIRRNGK